MSNLIAVAYPDQHRASEVLAVLHSLQEQSKIDLEDAVCVVRNPKGDIEVIQSQSRVGKKVTAGGVGGLLVGMLFLTPVVGVAVGAGAGYLAAARSPKGFDKEFINKLGANLEPGGSALVVLVRSSDRDAVLPAIRPYGGTVIQSQLAPELEAQLQAALAGDESNKPMGARLDIPIGATVYCSDGVGGKITQIIIDPITMQVSHIAIRAHESFGHDVFAPTNLISASTPEAVRLSVSRAELAEMPTYRYQGHADVPQPYGPTLDRTAYDTIGYSGYGAQYGMLRNQDDALAPGMPDMVTFEDGAPPGTLSLRHGDEVWATDGKVGKIDQLLISREKGTITHIVLQDGHLWGKTVVPIPLSDVKTIEEGTVYLKLSKEQVTELPKIPLGDWQG